MKRISFLLALLLLISAGCGKAGNKSESITLEVAGKMTSEEYYKIGFTKDSLKDFTGSIAAFTKAIELEPQNSNDYLYRALSKGILEDQIGEFADLSMAIKIDPTNALAYYHRGMIQDLDRNREGAIADYSMAIEIDPAKDLY